AREDGQVLRLLPGEGTELGRDVLVEAAVAVQVVRRDVQERCRAGVERVRVLELEARALDHQPDVRIDGAGQPGDRRPLVAAGDGGDAGRVHEMRRELGGRRLPVRAGDRDHRVRHGPRGELDLTPDGRAGGPRGGHRRDVAGHAWALHHHVHAPHGPRRRREQLDTRRGQFRGLDRRPVEGDRLVAEAGKEQRGGAARAPEPHHQRAPGRAEVAHPWMSRKNSVKPTAPSRAAISQKRTMILVSLHAAISKWWWIGVIRNTRRRNRLKTITCTITESASITKTAPMMSRRISVLVMIASAAMAPPREYEPVSPMKIAAGNELNQRKPRHAPTIAAPKIARSRWLLMPTPAVSATNAMPV